MPQDCRDFAQRTDVQKKPEDIKVYSVNYEDCLSPWIICYHKDSQTPFPTVLDRFGRIPIGARQFVRHLVIFPNPGVGAKHGSGSIAIFGDALLPSYFHEVGHAVDLMGGYVGGQLSSSKEWTNAIEQDAHVPDEKAAQNLKEDVAQIFVVIAIDLTLPGGYQTIQPEWQKIRHQATLLRKWQAESGNLLVPRNGKCGKRLSNSNSVEVNNAGAKLRRGARARGEIPDISLDESLEVIPNTEFDTDNENFEDFGAGHKQ
ncbi:MAG: hypothetical protein Q9185_006338 [Variospora sp. 1 TL-2023]